MNTEDFNEIDRAGRRCAICRSGHRWRRFSVLRSDGREPVVMCAACRARYGDAPPAAISVPSEPAPVVSTPAPRRERTRQHEDRVKKALRELARGEHSTGRIAKAARLNHTKTLGRLRQLEAAGEIRRVGDRWSTEQPSTDVERAFDRLQARTSNIRIITDRRSRA